MLDILIPLTLAGGLCFLGWLLGSMTTWYSNHQRRKAIKRFVEYYEIEEDRDWFFVCRNMPDDQLDTFFKAISKVDFTQFTYKTSQDENE